MEVVYKDRRDWTSVISFGEGKIESLQCSGVLLSMIVIEWRM